MPLFPPGDSDDVRPSFNAATVMIYVRTTGSDDTGDGSVGSPFRTMQRAIREVPNEIPAGTIYRVDISGIGLETLPEHYEFPVFVAADGVGAFDFTHRYFHYYCPVNVQAYPQLATGVDGLTTITSGSLLTPKATTGLKAIQVAGAGWTPGQLKGKFAISAGTATKHSVIWDNTADTIYLTRTGDPTFPVEIMEPSAHLQAPKDSGILHSAAVNIHNTPIALLGLKVSSQGNDSGDFGMWGLDASGASTSPSFQLCHLDGAGFNTTVWSRVRQCFLSNLMFAMAPNLFVQSYISGSLSITPGGSKVTMWGARGVDSLFRQTVIEKTITIHYRDLFDNFWSGAVGFTQLQNVQILDTITEFPSASNGTVNDGILWTGGILQCMGVDISRSAPGSGSAICARGPNAHVQLRSTSGINYDIGVTALDGAHVEMHDDGASATTTLSGTTGVFKAGSLPIEANWPSAVYPAAGSNFVDFTGSLAQGVRVWRRS